MARKSSPVPPVGATTLLTVFAVLCLTVFALLTLSDVRSDAALADASLDSVRAYYAADAKAQELLARLRDGQRPEGVSLSDGTAQYAVPISDTQELQVSVILEDPDRGAYRITRWQCVSTQPWEGEDGLQLWLPE